jgi:preprotein translocase subunit SecE
VSGDDGDYDDSPAQLGAARYVMAAFFAAGVFVAYLSGKMLASLWNWLAEMPQVTEAVPFLLQRSEDERLTITMVLGAMIGILGGAIVYKKEGVRSWADEVASELSKVTWPDKETVQNGTVVVIIASIFATIYVGLLDRLWHFITIQIYGA